MTMIMLLNPGGPHVGWALHALSIDIIGANSSQAKGRIKRAHKPLQHRLINDFAAGRHLARAAGNALLRRAERALSKA